MLHKLRDLELSSNQISFADAGAGLAQTLTVNGRDDQGYAAPIELQDMTLDYDHSLIQIDQTAPGQLKITPLKAGGTTLDVKVGDQDEKAAVTIGVVQQNVYTFNHSDEVSRWSVNGTVAANQKLGLSSDGYLKLTYKAERNSGLSRQDGRSPSRARRCACTSSSTRRPALQYAYINFRGADGVNYGPLVLADRGRRQRHHVHVHGRREVPGHAHLDAGDRDQRRQPEGRRRHLQVDRRGRRRVGAGARARSAQAGRAVLA